jgi:putative DNA primase/helicase
VGGFVSGAVTSEIFDQARQAISRTLIETVAPGGYWKNDGDYWAPSPLRAGSDGRDSFHIFEYQGAWCYKDWAGGEEKGGDFIGLVVEWRSCSKKEAAEWILGQTGNAIPDTKPAKVKKPKPEAVMPIPEDAAALLNAEVKGEYARKHHGIFAKGWKYRDAQGGWVFAVARYTLADGSKDITPYYFGSDNRWHEGKPKKDGLPLYRLPELLASPDLPVLVVEGEKCADAAVKALPGWAVVTWSSGASSVGKTDWTPLAGREVTIWPDADEPGARAAAQIVALVPGAEVLAVEGRAPGWDIADAVAEGLDVARFIAECPRIGSPEPETDDPDEEAPFRAIGYDAECYWFLLGSQRQPYTIAKGSFNGSKLGELAPPAWWAKHNAINDKGGIDVTRGQQIVIDAENKRGIFDPASLRGAGVWLDRGEIVINDGERIVDPDGRAVPLTEYQGSAEYVRSSVHFGDMTGPEATDEEGKALLALVAAQRWARGVDAVAVAGWSLIAPFGGLLSFRPHLWISGRKGTGKTFVLENIIREICGPFAHQGSGKDTEAGIRRTLNMDARPVILDEMEPKGRARENVTKILDLARNASSDGSGRVTMADGKGTVSFLIRSCFCFASINTVVEEGAAIASRIVGAELVAPKTPAEEKAKIEKSRKLYRLAMQEPGRYRRRIFRALPRITADIARLRESLPACLGGAREADLWAPIFAAAWAAQSEESIASPAGIAWLESILSEEEATRQTVPEDEDRVIEHILGATLESDDRKKKTVAEWLEISQRPSEGEGYVYAEDIIARLGLRVMNWRGRRVLAIATNSDALARLLRDTPYESGYDSQIKRNALCLTPEKPERERLAGAVKTCRLLDWPGFRQTYMEEVTT